jgi:hypothetical protein
MDGHYVADLDIDRSHLALPNGELARREQDAGGKQSEEYGSCARIEPAVEIGPGRARKSFPPRLNNSVGHECPSER